MPCGIISKMIEWAIYLGAVYLLTAFPFQFIVWRHRKNEKRDSVNSGAKFG